MTPASKHLLSHSICFIFGMHPYKLEECFFLMSFDSIRNPSHDKENDKVDSSLKQHCTVKHLRGSYVTIKNGLIKINAIWKVSLFYILVLFNTL